MAKRILLFLMTNILVVLSISIILSLLNVQPYLDNFGLNIPALMVFCLIWGMTGSLISLMLSRMVAKASMGVKVISPNQAREDYEVELVAIVHQLARRAGIDKMPEVGIYNSEEINAFATGPTKNRSLVAVSSGLIKNFNREQVEGVLGHEVAHIANGDMVTMTLLQGIINAFVMFLARVIAYALTSSRNQDEYRRPGVMYHLTVFGLEMVLMFLGMLIIAAFSRYREYRADIGGANLAGKNKMLTALQGLKQLSEKSIEEESPVAALKISGAKKWLQLFSTHPHIEERINRIEKLMSV